MNTFAAVLTCLHLTETKELILVTSGIADHNSKARMVTAYETVNEDNPKYLLVPADPF